MRTFNSWILNVGDFKAVRKVPVSSISLTGEVLGKQFESSLERDLLYLTCWDGGVDWFQVQPVKIPYVHDGVRKTYTPDLLTFYRNSDQPDGKKPRLCEVKYRSDLEANWDEIYPKLRAGMTFAKSQGWVFKIYTEDKIRTPLLENIKFLWTYKFSESYPQHSENLLFRLNQLGSASINELLDACFPAGAFTARGEAIWAVWCLMARKAFICDLSVPLSMAGTRLTLNPNYPVPF